MSIIDAFDGLSEEMIVPRKRIKPVEGIAKTTIVVFEKHNFFAFIDRFPYQKIAEIDMGMGLSVYKILYKDEEINVFLSVQNTSAAAECLEILIAMGSTRFIYYGSCGTLDGTVTSESIILPQKAYRDEGMSYHYMPPGDFIAVSNFEKTKEAFEQFGVPYREAVTWTTEAVFRETRNKVERMKQAGCGVVEMECASIEAVGQFRNAEIYYFLYVEDNLGGLKWEPGTMGNRPESSAEKYADLALKLALYLK